LLRPAELKCQWILFDGIAMAKIPKNCEFFQPSGEFVIARLADKTFEIKYLVGKPKQTKTLYKKYVSHGV